MNDKQVTINERYLDQLSKDCSAKEGTWVQDVEAAVKLFIDNFTNGWASPSAAEFGQEIATCLESANKAVEAAIAELNARLGNAVGTHNAIHSTNISFTNIVNTLPGIGGMRALNKALQDGSVGYITSYKDRFKSNMESIEQAYITLVNGMYNDILSSGTFSDYEQSKLAEGFDNIKKIITTGIQNLKNSFDERIANETSVVEAAQDQNVASYGAMGSN